ncbi:MAG: polysaccharide deacetylase family protein [Oligoflexia bacterium]|nr:polysaccharide deacetylase family protein [Oligoflexia bacterium]MBF0366620.1 polysaccharide deacetylase family protein [Oligoflexia bacterium]
MSVSVCFYFQVHQPFRLRKDYNFFSIGPDHSYEDVNSNRSILLKIANKCYLPTNNLMLKLINRHKGAFKISYSISGVILEQFELYAPHVLDSFKALVDTGCVELINETYYHSLSFLKSKDEFREQVTAHKNKIRELFGYNCTTFRNTELIYNNELAAEVEKMGYKTILAEGIERILGWRSPNFVYYPASAPKLKLLLKNYRLSDDIAFRFSNRGWHDFPLTAEKYASWVHSIAGNGEVIGLFMDYETFGEHQWEDTGIFNFMEALPEKIFAHPDYRFQTPSEVAQTYPPVGPIDSVHYVSWADIDRDLSAWLGNPMQDSALEFAYSLESAVKKTQDPALIHTWRKLLTSDHYYYVCTKWFNDGDVHKYFNPYENPYDAYMVYINVLNDLKLTLKQRGVLP